LFVGFTILRHLADGLLAVLADGFKPWWAVEAAATWARRSTSPWFPSPKGFLGGVEVEVLNAAKPFALVASRTDSFSAWSKWIESPAWACSATGCSTIPFAAAPTRRSAPMDGLPVAASPVAAVIARVLQACWKGSRTGRVVAGALAFVANRPDDPATAPMSIFQAVHRGNPDLTFTDADGSRPHILQFSVTTLALGLDS
jgi:hypothetical protein